MLAAINRHLESSAQTIIDLQRSLVGIPALGPLNGGPGEKDKTEFLKSYLKDMGFAEIREMRAPDPHVPCGYRPSIAAIIPGRNSAKTFWVISHTDIVPPGDLALWDSDPYTLKVDGDILVGRGVEDNHQGIVSSLVVAKALLDLKLTPGMNYGVLLVAGLLLTEPPWSMLCDALGRGADETVLRQRTVSCEALAPVGVAVKDGAATLTTRLNAELCP